MKNNKKGISAVVATVLIILITVAAVTIIWAAIIPMINSQLSRGTVCLDAMSALSIENKGFTCYDAAANEVKVQIAHGSQSVGLDDIQILISDNTGNTETFLQSTESGNLPTENGESVVTVDTSGMGNPASTIAIAPVVLVGGQQETCDASSAVTLTAC